MTELSPLEATLARLNDQLSWYDKKSQQNQRLQKTSTVAQICIASSIPIAAWLAPNWIPAVLGAIIAVVRGLESAYQWEYNWINYRSTAEKLKHEKFFYEACAGPYDDSVDPQKQLAQRVEGSVSREHASWITVRTERGKGKKNDDAGADN